MSYWISYNADTIQDIKPLPATYVIYSDSGLIYIGQASNAKARIGQYRIRFSQYSNGIFHSIKEKDVYSRHILIKVYYSRRVGDWAMREIRLIKRLKPLLNHTHGGQKKRAERGAKKQPLVIYQEMPSDEDLMFEMMAEEQMEYERELEAERDFFLSPRMQNARGIE